MAMSLQLARPWRLRLSSDLPTRPVQCNSCARMSLGGALRIAPSRWEGGGRLRPRGVLPGFKSRQGLCLGLRGVDVVVAAAAAAAAAGGAGDADSGEAEVVAEEVRDPEENSSFPEEFKDLIVDRGDPPNLFLYAAGFCVIVLMRDVILQEFANWGINFARVALYIAEGITIGLGKLTNIAAEPLAFLMTVANWAIMAVDDIYTLIVDGAPVRSFLNSLVLAFAVLSIGDAASSTVKGSRSRLVGIATAIGLAGVLELIPLEAVIPSLALLTAFAKIFQKADLVTLFMPATVSFVTIAEPILQAIAFGIFLAVSIYANWRAAQQPVGESSEKAPSERREIKASAARRPSLVFLAITASICISLAARCLYLRSVKWLLLRTT